VRALRLYRVQIEIGEDIAPAAAHYAFVASLADCSFAKLSVVGVQQMDRGMPRKIVQYQAVPNVASRSDVIRRGGPRCPQTFWGKIELALGAFAHAEAKFRKPRTVNASNSLVDRALAGEASIVKPHRTAKQGTRGMATPLQEQRLTHQQRCILKSLAGTPWDAVDELFVLANGFDIDVLTGLIRDGLATAWRETIRAAGGPAEVTRIAITDAGRNALRAGRTKRGETKTLRKGYISQPRMPHR
jgi:hypothetical protein